MRNDHWLCSEIYPHASLSYGATLTTALSPAGVNSSTLIDKIIMPNGSPLARDGKETVEHRLPIIVGVCTRSYYDLGTFERCRLRERQTILGVGGGGES